jgi:hypothetical protein
MRKIVGGWCMGMLVLAMPALVRAEDPSARAIIDKGIEARGGAEKLAKAQNFKGKGTFYGLGQAIEFSGQWWIQPPDKLKNIISVDAGGQKFDIVQVVNGDKGWHSMMGNVDEMNEEQLKEAKDEMYAGQVAQLVVLKDPEYKLATLGASKVGDADVLGVKVSRKDHRDVTLFFDKKIGLLLKTEHKGKDQMSGQEVLRATIYGDYKDQDGLKVPMKVSTKQDGKDFVEMTVTEYKPVDKLDDQLFSKPSS